MPVAGCAQTILMTSSTVIGPVCPRKVTELVIVARRNVVRPIRPDDPAGQRQRPLMHIVLGIVADTHREEFHQLARVVLVGRVAGTKPSIQPVEHGWINRDRVHQVVELPQPLRAQQLVLLDHERQVRGAANLGEAAGQHAMPEERQLLLEWARAVDHAQQHPANQILPVGEVEVE